jgi:uncharacterized protein YndB with AHSA1/START domain
MKVEREVEFPAPPEEVWAALTEAERLEEWFANDVELDPRPGGEAIFRWANGEERRAIVEDVQLEERFAIRWEDEGGEVVFTLEPTQWGTLVRVVESSPEWTTALEFHALACVPTR